MMGENGPLYDIQDLKIPLSTANNVTIGMSMSGHPGSLASVCVTLESSRVNIKLKNSHVLTWITGHLQGDCACERNSYPWNATRREWYSNPATSGLPETKFRISAGNAHSTTSDAGINMVWNGSWISVLFIPFLTTWSFLVLRVLCTVMHYTFGRK